MPPARTASCGRCAMLWCGASAAHEPVRSRRSKTTAPDGPRSRSTGVSFGRQAREKCRRGFPARMRWSLRPFQRVDWRSPVPPDRIGVIGWSEAGGAVLFPIRAQSLGRPAQLLQGDFLGSRRVLSSLVQRVVTAGMEHDPASRAGRCQRCLDPRRAVPICRRIFAPPPESSRSKEPIPPPARTRSPASPPSSAGF
jgi:hypothetical protein